MTAEESTSINNQYNNDSNFNEDETVPKFKPAPITQQPKQNTQMRSYAQEFPIPKNEHTGYGSFINCLGSCLGFCGAIPCCPMPTPYKEVKQGEVGLLSRFGAFYKSVDPGLVKINLCSEDLRRVSVRTKSANIRDQVAITKDNVSVRIDSVIYYQIEDPYKAIYTIENFEGSLIERSQITLRNVIGGANLQDVIQNRARIAKETEEIISTVTNEWGVSVSISIKDVHLSAELSESLSAVVRQKRLADAKIIAAKSEVEAAKLMKQTSELLSSPAARHIRQLDTLKDMAKTTGSKVIFMPMSASEDASGNPIMSSDANTNPQPSPNPLSQVAGLNAIENI